MGLKFKRILFDNMGSSQLKMFKALCKNKYQTEYSGNATLKISNKYLKQVLIEFLLGLSHTVRNRLIHLFI